jgi:hypothetical protein
VPLLCAGMCSDWDIARRYQADNHFLLSGYRLEMSWRESFISLFQWHNETINVWTHLMGGFLFLCTISAVGAWNNVRHCICLLTCTYHRHNQTLTIPDPPTHRCTFQVRKICGSTKRCSCKPC